MIKFFRKIRQNNLSGTKFNNYLIYTLTTVITVFSYTDILSQTNTVLDTLSDNKLYTHNEKYYVKSTKIPFTGVRMERYTNGKKRFEYHYVNGERHGLFTTWYKNGVKEREWTQVNTGEVITGIESRWNRIGVKTVETNHDTGLRTLWREWYGITHVDQELLKNSKIKYTCQRTFYSNKSPRTEYYQNKFGMIDSISTYWYPDGTKGEEIIYEDTQEKSWTVWDHKGRKFRPYLDVPFDTILRNDYVLDFDPQRDGLYYLKDSDKPYTGLFFTEGLLLNSENDPTEWNFDLTGFKGQNYKTEVLMILGQPHGPHKQFDSDGDIISESYIEQSRFNNTYSSWNYHRIQKQQDSESLSFNTKLLVFFLLLIGCVVIFFLKKKKLK